MLSSGNKSDVSGNVMAIYSLVQILFAAFRIAVTYIIFMGLILLLNVYLKEPVFIYIYILYINSLLNKKKSLLSCLNIF